MKYLVFGANGQLGSQFVRQFSVDNTNFTALSRSECDITDINSVNNAVSSIKPNIIINCAAYNLVDDAEKDSFIAYNINQKGTQNIAQISKENGAFLIHYSTDYVFDGSKGDFYSELDATNPINEYGKSKLLGESAIRDILDNYLIFRLSWVYGEGKQNFIYKFNEWAKKNKSLNITEDEYSIPTSTNLIVHSTLQAINKDLNGLFHLTPNGFCSRYEWAEEIAKLQKLDVDLNKVKISTFNLPAKRPYNSAMSNKLISNEIGTLPSWTEDLKNFLKKSFI